jgi:hypothetical protein
VLLSNVGCAYELQQLLFSIADLTKINTSYSMSASELSVVIEKTFNYKDNKAPSIWRIYLLTTSSMKFCA